MTYRILSLDGGGIRGILTARIIARLGVSAPSWWKSADMFAGTSTGGILALGFAFGLSADDCVKLYAEGGSKIFAKRDWVDSVTHLDEMWRANFGNEGLIDVLDEAFGQAKIGDLEARVFVPTFNLETWRPEFIDSDVQKWEELSLVEAALMTSAAPTYFPSYGKYIDGGVTANNPSACALAAAHTSGLKSDDVVLCSIGTGFNPNSMEGGDHGYKSWLPKMIPLLMDGPQKAEEYKVRMQLGERQIRINPELKKVIDLADYEACDDLIAAADDEDLRKADFWISNFWSDAA